MNLTTQDKQIACFQNVAAHLVPGGCFVIEVMVPELQRLPPGETFRPFTVSATKLGFDDFRVQGYRCPLNYGQVCSHIVNVGHGQNILSMISMR